MYELKDMLIPFVFFVNFSEKFIANINHQIFSTYDVIATLYTYSPACSVLVWYIYIKQRFRC
jgi:hypothetical protein